MYTVFSGDLYVIERYVLWKSILCVIVLAVEGYSLRITEKCALWRGVH